MSSAWWLTKRKRKQVGAVWRKAVMAPTSCGPPQTPASDKHWDRRAWQRVLMQMPTRPRQERDCARSKHNPSKAVREPNEERGMRTIKELKSMTQKLLGNQWGDKKYLSPSLTDNLSLIPEPMWWKKKHNPKTHTNTNNNDGSFAAPKTRWIMDGCLLWKPSPQQVLQDPFYFLPFSLADYKFLEASDIFPLLNRENI